MFFSNLLPQGATTKHDMMVLSATGIQCDDLGQDKN